MNKKIITLLIILLMLLNLPIFAAGSCTINSIPRTAQKSSITISGTVRGGNHYLQVFITDPSDNVRFSEQLVIDQNRAYSRTIFIPTSWPEGDYKVTAGYENAHISTTFFVVDIVPFDNVINAIATADSTTIAEILGAASPHITAFTDMGLEIGIYNQFLNADGKALLQSALLDIQALLNKPTISENTEIIRNTFNNAMPYAMVNTAKTSDEMKKALDLYCVDFFNVEDLSADEKAFFAGYLLVNGPVDTLASFAEKSADSLKYHKINSASFVSMSQNIIDSEVLLGLTGNSYYAQYLTYSEANKEKINKAIVISLSENNVYKADSFRAVFIKAVSENPPTTQGSTSSGGGGGGGGGSYAPSGGFSAGVDYVKEVNKPIEKEAVSFSDLETVSWANDAITELAKRNILSGKTGTQFFPNDNITREEFVKILVLTFNFQLSDEKSSFTDVNEDDWFCKYVAALEKTGIVKGDSEGRFGSYNNITRQDAAVLLDRVTAYKSLSILEVDEGVIFNDRGDISEYALDSVELMNKCHIMGGSYGNFYPASYLTRAEAATIVYRLERNLI